jgi:predicted RNA-binding protein with PIN domain
MLYYIDGYNLMFRSSRESEDFSAQRASTIRSLQKQAQQLRLSVTVIFDAYQIAEESLPSHSGALKIIYTSAGETADEWILSAIDSSSRPSNITVVTSDGALATRARQAGAKTISTEAFSSWIYKRSQRQVESKIHLQPSIQPLPPSSSNTTAPTQPAVIAKPSKKMTAESCFDYYLRAFGGEVDAEDAGDKNDRQITSLYVPQQHILRTMIEQSGQQHSEEHLLEYYEKIFEQRIAEEE